MLSQALFNPLFGIDSTPPVPPEPFPFTLLIEDSSEITGVQTLTTEPFTPPANSKLFVFAVAQANNYLANFNGFTLVDSLSNNLYSEGFIQGISVPHAGDIGRGTLGLFCYLDIGLSPEERTITFNPAPLSSPSTEVISIIVFAVENINGYNTYGISYYDSISPVSSDNTILIDYTGEFDPEFSEDYLIVVTVTSANGPSDNGGIEIPGLTNFFTQENPILKLSVGTTTLTNHPNSFTITDLGLNAGMYGCIPTIVS